MNIETKSDAESITIKEKFCKLNNEVKEIDQKILDQCDVMLQIVHNAQEIIEKKKIVLQDIQNLQNSLVMRNIKDLINKVGDKREEFASHVKIWNPEIEDFYMTSHKAAQTLYIQMLEYYEAYEHDNDLKKFKECMETYLETEEVEEYMEILNTPRGFPLKMIIANIAFCLATLVIPGLVTFAARAAIYGTEHTFFQPNTDSANKMLELQDSVGAIKI